MSTSFLQCAAVATTVIALPFYATAQQAPFQLQSPAFADGGTMDKRYAGNNPAVPSCTGDNVSPPLEWRNAPPDTRSFALIEHDQEGMYGKGVDHWIIYGIPGSITSLAEGVGAGPGKDFIGGSNIYKQPTYAGGCPPAGTGPHHYVFTIIATDLAPDALKPGLSKSDLLAAIGSHAIGAAGLVGRFGQ